MKYLQLTMMALVYLTVLSCQSDSENQKNEFAKRLSKVADTTVAACKMTDQEQVQRSERLRKELFSQVRAVKELDDGYALQLPGDQQMMDKVWEHIQIEKECCPFFEFEITLTPENGPVWLKFKGGRQIKELLRADMEQLQQAIDNG